MVKSGTKRKTTTLADASLDASIEMLQIADSLESNIGAGIEACITRLRTIDVKGVAGVVKKLESYRKGVWLCGTREDCVEREEDLRDWQCFLCLSQIGRRLRWKIP